MNKKYISMNPYTSSDTWQASYAKEAKKATFTIKHECLRFTVSCLASIQTFVSKRQRAFNK